MPGYYRAVFPGGDRPDFDPVQVGVGLGITQGLVAGLVVGSVVVLAVSLASRRKTADEARTEIDLRPSADAE